MTHSLTDTQAWSQYPALNWLYNTTRLLDMQNIHWQPFSDETHTQRLPVFNLGELPESAHIYVEPLAGDDSITTVVLVKGAIQWQCVHQQDHTVIDQPSGDHQLRISGFCAMYLKKHTGIVTLHTTGTVLTAVNLRLRSELESHYPENFSDAVAKLYSKGLWNLVSSTET